METRVTPPPLPGGKKGMSLGLKIVLMGLICFVLIISTVAVWLMAYNREETNREVTSSILDQWGRGLTINKVSLVYRDLVKNGSYDDNAVYNNDDYVNTDRLDINIDAVAKKVHRGIYEAKVFEADIVLQGSFTPSDSVRVLESRTIIIGIDPNSITKYGDVTVNGIKTEWEPFDTEAGIRIPESELGKKISFKADFSARGSELVEVAVQSDYLTIEMEGDESDPSFNSHNYTDSNKKNTILPVSREISDKGFRAKWILRGEQTENCVYTRFLVGIDTYRVVTRSIKYAFIIIVLTFAAVFFTEIIKKQPIPLLNYFLIGAALIIFYTLLLAFSEHIRFGYAYIIAALMTVLLISGYMWRMLNSKTVGIFIGLLLAVIYTVCYSMLVSSKYALITGSLILFFALAAMMYGSLKIKS